MQKESDQKLIIVLVALLLLLGLTGAYFAYTIWGPKTTTSNPDGTTVATNKTTDKPVKKPIKTKKTDKTTDEQTDKAANDKTGKDADKTKTDQKEANLKDKKTDKKATGQKEAANEETLEPKETIEEDVTIEEETTSDLKPSGSGINLADIAKAFASQNKPQEKISTNPLDQMPNRKLSINNPFAFKKEVMQIPETTFAELQQQSIELAGKFNPFSSSGSITGPMDILTPGNSKLPDIPNIPDSIGIPADLLQNIPKMPDINFPPVNTGAQTIQQPVQQETSVVTKDSESSNLLSSTILTGILGNTAILKINNESRGLQVGQNYKGVVVLSISDKSVLLESDGVKVKRELRDRF